MMMSAFRATFPLLPALLAVVLASCSSMQGLVSEPEPEVVFALGARDGFSSPLVTGLKPACQALVFPDTRYSLLGAHEKLLNGLAESWPQGKPRYLIAGYAPPALPEDFARTLSERRAQAVRQFLIEHGVEAASLQTVGFGHDSAPSGPNSSVVVIYQQ